MKHANIERVLAVHYNTDDNPLTFHTLAELNDVQQLQVFEHCVSVNKDVRSYDCHIASQALYKQQAKDTNNVVYEWSLSYVFR
jgi:hypothetical protein